MSKEEAKANYATAVELGDIAVIATALTSLDERLRLRHSQVSFGDVPVYDANGESLGELTYEGSANAYVFRAVSS